MMIDLVHRNGRWWKGIGVICFLMTLWNLHASVDGIHSQRDEESLVHASASSSNRLLTDVYPASSQQQQQQQLLQQPQQQLAQPQQQQAPRPMTLTLIRGIGNALPPRHDPEQTFTNLNFTLMHEPEFPFVQKHWILNRLMDPVLEARIVRLLESHGHNYTVVPFDLEEYAMEPWSYEYDEGQRDLVHTYPYHTLQMIPHCANYTYNRAHMTVDDLVRKFNRTCFNVFEIRANLIEETIQHEKNLYVTNQNKVRNLMLEIGVDQYNADWILPWDGNCFLTFDAYQEIYQALAKQDTNVRKYAWTPMARAQTNEEVLQQAYKPKAIEEPQLIFHRSAQGRFHDRLRYGRRNKIEMIQRLHIRGPWDKWSPYLPWEYKELDPLLEVVPDVEGSEEAKPVQIGFVTRLSSGRSHLEQKGVIKARGHSRAESMTLVLTNLDVKVASQLHGYDPSQLLFYKEEQLRKERDDMVLMNQLQETADLALTAGPWSVTGKRRSLWNPTHNPRDYYHASPELLSSLHLKSRKTDHDRWTWMVHNTTVLALAHYMTGRADYAETAARNVRTWFLKWKTRMNPHLANCDIYYNNTSKRRRGIYELKDVYMLLDAIRILERHNNYLAPEEQSELRDWFRQYALWLETSEEGKREYTAPDYRGVFYDIQMVSIHSYTNNTAKMLWYLDRSVARLRAQVITEQDRSRMGMLVKELELFGGRRRCPDCEENQMLALQAWAILSRLGRSAGRNIWNAYPVDDVSNLCHASFHAIPFFRERSQCATPHYTDEEDTSDGSTLAVLNHQRWWPLWLEAREHCEHLREFKHVTNGEWMSPTSQLPPKLAYDMPAMYTQRAAIAPFWNLGLHYNPKETAKLPTGDRPAPGVSSFGGGIDSNNMEPEEEEEEEEGPQGDAAFQQRLEAVRAQRRLRNGQ